MHYRFLPKAELELNQSIDYYENHQIGLGSIFSNEIIQAINSIKDKN